MVLASKTSDLQAIWAGSNHRCQLSPRTPFSLGENVVKPPKLSSLVEDSIEENNVDLKLGQPNTFARLHHQHLIRRIAKKGQWVVAATTDAPAPARPSNFSSVTWSSNSSSYPLPSLSPPSIAGPRSARLAPLLVSIAIDIVAAGWGSSAKP